MPTRSRFAFPNIGAFNPDESPIPYELVESGKVRIEVLDADMILIDDFWSEDMEYNDLGYPRVLTRSDGKMVAIFYYSTKNYLHHIHATIWDPNTNNGR